MLLSGGLACIAAPILIHILMRRRRRPVPWGAMKFLLEAYRRQRRRMNLEQVLLLVSRCLLVALLAIALGRPVVGALTLPGAGGPRTVYLLLDNGLNSTASLPGEDSALDRSRTLALTMLEGLDAGRGDRAALIALASPAEALVMPPTSDLAGVRARVREVRAADARADLPGGLARVTEELARAEGHHAEVAVLSEFRVGSIDPATALAALPRRGGETLLIAQPPGEEPLSNFAISGLQSLRPVLVTGGGESTDAQPATFRVSVLRSGEGLDRAASSTVRVRVSSNPGGPTASGQSSMAWSPGQSQGETIVSLDVPAVQSGTPLAAVAELERDAIDADNLFRIPLDARDRLEVGVLAPGGSTPAGGVDQYTPADWITLALAPRADLAARRGQGGELRLSMFDVSRPALASGTGLALSDADAIVLPRPDLLDASGWNEVAAVASRGALVLVFAPPGIETHAWTDAFTSALGLEWTIGRQALQMTPPARLATRAAGGELNMLSFIGGEFEELASPVTVSRLLPVTESEGSHPLLTLEGGLPIATVASPSGQAAERRGHVVFFGIAMDLAWTDLPARPLMVPMLQEIIRQGIGRGGGGGGSLGIAGSSPILPVGTLEVVPKESRGGAGVSRVEAGVMTPPIRVGGLYTARGAGGVPLGVIAMNSDGAGGDVTTRSREDVGTWLGGGLGPEVAWIGDGEAAPSTRIEAAGRRTQDEHSPFTLPLLSAALLLGIVEAFFGRWFSHASLASAALGVKGTGR